MFQLSNLSKTLSNTATCSPGQEGIQDHILHLVVIPHCPLYPETSFFVIHGLNIFEE